jgi:hypothetical protein
VLATIDEEKADHAPGDAGHPVALGEEAEALDEVVDGVGGGRLHGSLSSLSRN